MNGPAIIRFDGKGPVETEIVSADHSPHGCGVFRVRITDCGIEIRHVGEKDWKKHSFADLMLMDVRELLLECDEYLERYNSFQVEKIKQLESRLSTLKAATASELSAIQRRREMRKQNARELTQG